MHVEQLNDVLNERQRRYERTSSRSFYRSIFGQSKMKTFGIVSILLILTSVVTLIGVNYNKLSSKTNQGVNEKNGVPSITKSSNNDDQSSLSAKRRVPRSLKRLGTPDDTGFMIIYIRQKCDGNRQKTLDKLRLPYVRYDRDQVQPSSAFVRVSQSLEIYVDQLTQQTVIYSSKSAYILPYIRNANGNVFSIAKLLAAEYASFVSTGIPISTDFKIEDFENHGGDPRKKLPRFDSRKGIFSGAIRSKLRSNFKSKCGQSDSDESDELPKQKTKNPFYNKPRSKTRKSSSQTTTETSKSTHTSTEKSTTDPTQTSEKSTHSSTHTSTESTHSSSHTSTDSTHSSSHSSDGSTHSSSHSSTESTHSSSHSSDGSTHSSSHSSTESTHSSSHSSDGSTHSSTHSSTESTHSSSHSSTESTHSSSHSSDGSTHSSTHSSTDSTHSSTHSSTESTHSSTHSSTDSTHSSSHSSDGSTHSSTHSSTDSTHSSSHSSDGSTHSSTHSSTDSTHSSSHSSDGSTHSSSSTSTDSTHSSSHSSTDSTHSSSSTSTQSTHSSSSTSTNANA